MRTEHTAVGGESSEGVLRELGTYAVERGYASEGYAEALLDREAEFPTGLSIPTAPLDVAIPHADPEYVEESAVVLALPGDPIRFRSMDDPKETVEAGVIMLLLIEDGEAYTTLLSNLSNLFQSPAFPEAVRARNPEEVLALVDEECL